MEQRFIHERLDMHETHVFILILRLATLTLLVALLSMHIRSLRVFRWEQSMSGGVVVTFTVSALGLAICAGNDHCGGLVLQVYLCGTGAAMLAINAAVLYQRWRRAGELTLVVAEFLVALGVPLKRQLMTKVFLSAAAATGLLIDLALTPLTHYHAK